jgi:hypothetical protein
MATTTPNYGWDVPTSSDYVKDGATAIETLGDDIDATLGVALNNKLHAGLVLVKTQTIGTAVSSVTVTGAFSATYDAYKIIITGGAGSAGDVPVNLRLGSTTSNYFSSTIYAAYSSTTLGNTQNSFGSSFRYAGAMDSGGIYVVFDLLNPFLTKHTIIRGSINDTQTAGTMNGKLVNTTSYTDFTFLAETGTMTGGTIAVYGYAKD